MGKLVVKTTKLQDVKLITPAVFGTIGGSLRKLILIVILKQRGLILILFKIINHFLLRLVFCAGYIFNGAKLRKLS